MSTIQTVNGHEVEFSVDTVDDYQVINACIRTLPYTMAISGSSVREVYRATCDETSRCFCEEDFELDPFD